MHRESGVSWLHNLKTWSLHTPCQSQSSQKLAFTIEHQRCKRISWPHWMVSHIRSRLRTHSLTHNLYTQENQGFCMDQSSRASLHLTQRSSHLLPYSCITRLLQTFFSHHWCKWPSHRRRIKPRRKTSGLWVKEAQNTWAKLPNPWPWITCSSSRSQNVATLSLW